MRGNNPLVGETLATINRQGNRLPPQGVFMRTEIKHISVTWNPNALTRNEAIVIVGLGPFWEPYVWDPFAGEWEKIRCRSDQNEADGGYDAP